MLLLLLLVALCPTTAAWTRFDRLRPAGVRVSEPATRQTEELIVNGLAIKTVAGVGPGWPLPLTETPNQEMASTRSPSARLSSIFPGGSSLMPVTTIIADVSLSGTGQSQGATSGVQDISQPQAMNPKADYSVGSSFPYSSSALVSTLSSVLMTTEQPPSSRQPLEQQVRQVLTVVHEDAGMDYQINEPSDHEISERNEPHPTVISSTVRHRPVKLGNLELPWRAISSDSIHPPASSSFQSNIPRLQSQAPSARAGNPGHPIRPTQGSRKRPNKLDISQQDQSIRPSKHIQESASLGRDMRGSLERTPYHQPPASSEPTSDRKSGKEVNSLFPGSSVHAVASIEPVSLAEEPKEGTPSGRQIHGSRTTTSRPALPLQKDAVDDSHGVSPLPAIYSRFRTAELVTGSPGPARLRPRPIVDKRLEMLLICGGAGLGVFLLSLFAIVLVSVRAAEEERSGRRRVSSPGSSKGSAPPLPVRPASLTDVSLRSEATGPARFFGQSGESLSRGFGLHYDSVASDLHLVPSQTQRESEPPPWANARRLGGHQYDNTAFSAASLY